MLISAFFCLACSATYHLYFVTSPSISKVLAKLDYAGIAFLIFGSVVPACWYSFACEEVSTRRWNWVAANFILDAACFITTLMPKFDTAQYRMWRGVIYVAAGLFCGLVFLEFSFYQSDYIQEF